MLLYKVLQACYGQNNFIITSLSTFSSWSPQNFCFLFFTSSWPFKKQTNHLHGESVCRTRIGTTCVSNPLHPNQSMLLILFLTVFYREWLEGDKNNPPPPDVRKKGRNSDWGHLFNRDVVSMPDKWEYPWYVTAAYQGWPLVGGHEISDKTTSLIQFVV